MVEYSKKEKEFEMVKWSNGNVELSKSKDADTWYCCLSKNLDYYLSKDGKINKDQYRELDKNLFQVKLSLTKLKDYNFPTRLAIPNMLRTLRQLRIGGSIPDQYDLQEKFIETTEMLSDYLEKTGFSPYIYLDESGASGLGIYTKREMDKILDKKVADLLKEPEETKKENDVFYTSVMDACSNLKDELKAKQVKKSLEQAQTLSELYIQMDSSLDAKVGLVANDVLIGYWKKRVREALI